MPLALLLAAALFATDENGAPAPVSAPPAAAAAVKEKLICKNEPVTGTRFTKRSCRTPSQLAEDHRVARELLEKSAIDPRPRCARC